MCDIRDTQVCVGQNFLHILFVLYSLLKLSAHGFGKTLLLNMASIHSYNLLCKATEFFNEYPHLPHQRARVILHQDNNRKLGYSS